jgi:hypothetical protein
MHAAAFEAMVREMSSGIPREYFDGVTEVVVSSRTVPHPTRAGIFTLGECIPLPLDDDAPDAVQSRVVLYHGSFRALADLDPEFSWHDEAWETLTHELRHHVEWRARRGDLEALDRAAEANFARHDGEPFDPMFYLDGDCHVADVYQVDFDWFLDRRVRRPPGELEITWHGRRYHLAVPAGLSLPAYLHVTGVDDPPPGDLIVVLRRRPRLSDLFRAPQLFTADVVAQPLAASAQPET